MTEDIGRKGEALAAKYYMRRGYLLLNHNYRTRMGELDLVLYKDGQLIFAEVKTRAGRMLDAPAAAVDARKQRRLILAAQYYLQHSPYADASIRFDVVEVTPQAMPGRSIVSRMRSNAKVAMPQSWNIEVL